MELTALEQIILEVIDEITQIKHESNVVPHFATMVEVTNSLNVDIKEAINSLITKGRLEWHKNINGIPMFAVKQSPHE